MVENMTFYKYKVNWWYEDGNEDIEEEGFVLAKNYSHAMTQLDEAFDAINYVTIEAINDSNLLSYEDILETLDAKNKSSNLGPQIIAALQEAIKIAKEEV